MHLAVQNTVKKKIYIYIFQPSPAPLSSMNLKQAGQSSESPWVMTGKAWCDGSEEQMGHLGFPRPVKGVVLT